MDSSLSSVFSASSLSPFPDAYTAPAMFPVLHQTQLQLNKIT